MTATVRAARARARRGSLIPRRVLQADTLLSSRWTGRAGFYVLTRYQITQRQIPPRA